MTEEHGADFGASPQQHHNQDGAPEGARSQETVAQREVRWQHQHGIEDADALQPSQQTGAEMDAASGDTVV